MTSDWLEAGWQHVWLPYTAMAGAPLPLPAISAEGTRIRLADGRELLDGLSSWWTACHGYGHPHIVQTIRRQAETLPHIMFGGFGHEPALRLAKRLADLLPGDLSRVFFCDSGSVAVEVALKMAAQYWLNRGQTGRSRFLSFTGSYHGDTLGCMSVSDHRSGLHSALSGFIPDQLQTALPQSKNAQAEFDSLLAQERHRLAAVIVEPLVQGAGGMRFHDPDTLAAIAKACARHDVLLIADEVMTGFGRTGRMFACEEAGIVPDIVCLSKALTGGTIGLGATVATKRVFAAFNSDDPAKALMHGPSFMANPLACAAALASLDLFEREPRLVQVAAMETWLQSALAPCRNLPGVLDVRARGAIGVVQLTEMRHLAWLRRRFPEKGVFLRPFADIVYLMPAFIATEAEIGQMGEAVLDVLKEWQALG
jgi:adenosylmethionine-8-amino-7-oxononanoate aminotransferase